MARNTGDQADLFPVDYMSWRHCIEVKCGVPLTADYVSERIDVLRDVRCEETARFVRLYGEGWRQQVLAWFEHTARAA